MAVDWLTIRNDYINGGGSYRELAEKHGVSIDAIKRKAAAEKWRDSRTEHTQKIHQKTAEKTADAIAEYEADRVKKLLSITDKVIDRLEQAVQELDMAKVTNKTKTKVIEYKNKDRADKPTKEIITEKEEILSVSSIVDRKGLQQVAMALKAVWDMAQDDSGTPKDGDTREDDPLTKVLKEEAERMQNEAD